MQNPSLPPLLLMRVRLGLRRRLTRVFLLLSRLWHGGRKRIVRGAWWKPHFKKDRIWPEFSVLWSDIRILTGKPWKLIHKRDDIFPKRNALEKIDPICDPKQRLLTLWRICAQLDMKVMTDIMARLLESTGLELGHTHGTP